jgi:hypothetical protein
LNFDFGARSVATSNLKKFKIHNSKGKGALSGRLNSRNVGQFCALSLGDFSAPQAGSADAHLLAAGAGLGADRAQVYIPATAPHVMGVANDISKLRSLAADLAYLSHNYSSWNLVLLRKP